MTDDNVRKAATEDTELIEAVRWLSLNGFDDATWYQRFRDATLEQYGIRKREHAIVDRKARRAEIAAGITNLLAEGRQVFLDRQQATELAEFLSEEH